jgi:hypothetical protein
MTSPTSARKITRARLLHLSQLWQQAGQSERHRQAFNDAFQALLDDLADLAGQAEPDLPRMQGLADLVDQPTGYQLEHSILHLPPPVQGELGTIDIKRIAGLSAQAALAASGSPRQLTRADAIPIARAIFARMDDDQEHFVLLALDSHDRLYGFKRIHSGTPVSLDVDPALVFRSALLRSAYAIIVMHNHPSGDPMPSREDLQLTARLTACGRIVNVTVLDHIIVGQTGECRSLRPHHPELWHD